jgi:hypothetical protein
MGASLATKTSCAPVLVRTVTLEIDGAVEAPTITAAPAPSAATALADLNQVIAEVAWSIPKYLFVSLVRSAQDAVAPDDGA